MVVRVLEIFGPVHYFHLNDPSVQPNLYMARTVTYPEKRKQTFPRSRKLGETEKNGAAANTDV